MSEPRRPDPHPSWQERVRARFDGARHRWPKRTGEPSFGDDDDVDAISVGPDDSPSLVITAGVALVAAALAIGGLWMWQSWSQRSAEPIDDRLPLLVQSGLDPVAPEVTGVPTDSVALEVTSSHTNDTTPEASPTTLPMQIEAPVEVVHVSGAVLRPGVVDLPAGSRVFEAVALAGGPTTNADLDRINLAAPIVDGERIHVPSVGEEQAPTLVQPERPSVPATTGSPSDPAMPLIVPLDINAATAFELDMLPGIGPSTAEAIVALRTARGPFLSIEELLDVAGIGESKLSLLLPHVIVTVGG